MKTGVWKRREKDVKKKIIRQFLIIITQQNPTQLQDYQYPHKKKIKDV